MLCAGGASHFTKYIPGIPHRRVFFEYYTRPRCTDGERRCDTYIRIGGAYPREPACIRRYMGDLHAYGIGNLPVAWKPDAWMRIVCEIDFPSKRQKVWIDGRYCGAGPFLRKEAEAFSALQFVKVSGAEFRAVFDDLRVLDGPPAGLESAASLLVNGSFERGFSPWSKAATGGAVTLSAAFPAQGLSCALLSVHDDGGTAELKQAVAAPPGSGARRCELRFALRTEGPASGFLDVELRPAGASRGESLRQIPFERTTQLRRLSAEFSIPETQSGAKLLVVARKTGPGYVWIDAIELTCTPAAPMDSQGSVPK